MSVRKRTWANGTKSAWVVDYHDQTGSRKLRTFDRKTDAVAFEATAKVEVRAGTHTADSDSITVEAAAEQWLTEGRKVTAKRQPLEPTTLAQRDQHVRLHIVPLIGKTKLSRLTVPMIERFESDMLNNGRSAAMARKVMTSLSGILSTAVRNGRVARNVMLDRGRRGGTRDRHKRRLEVGVDIPTPAEVRAIVGALDGPYRDLVLVALFTGLRASEVRGIDWSDVDLDAGRLHVRQRANIKGTLGSPKSAAGRRSVPLTPIALNALKVRKLATGGAGLVFGTVEGMPETMDRLIRHGWQPAQVAAGVVKPAGTDADGRPITVAKYPGLHAARHFYASWCINPREAGGLGLDAKTVQERLGHSGIAITLDTYGHLFPRRDDAEELAAGEAALLGG